MPVIPQQPSSNGSGKRRGQVVDIGDRFGPGRNPSQPLESGDPRWHDPAEDVAGMPPNYGDFPFPHVYTFSGIFGSPANVYRISDEALRHSYDNSRFMLNDPAITECLEQRQRSLALLDWHLETDDPDNPLHKEVVERLTQLIRLTPRFMQYRENLHRAIWFGRSANTHRWRWRKVDGAMRLVLDRWNPVHGDKLVFRFDRNTGGYNPDQIGIRVGATYRMGDKITDRWKVEEVAHKIMPTDAGLAYFLEPGERHLIAVHKHLIEDGEWETPEYAGRVNGVGIRSKIYWVWYMKQECQAWLLEFLERSAFGVEIWTYPYGNEEARESAKQAATERIGNGRNVVLFPKPPGEEGVYGYDRIEPAMAGAEVLKSIMHEYFGHLMKRYILGQTLTSEAAPTGLGSNLASVHLDTYLQIVRYDAVNLQESITTDLVEPLKLLNSGTHGFPVCGDLPVRFVIDTESDDAQNKLQLYQAAFNMGVGLKESELMEIIGAQMPQADDKVLRVTDLNAAANPMDAGAGGQLPMTNDEGAAAIAGAMGLEPQTPDESGPVEAYSKDAEGHEHKGKGPGGGQFTSSGSSSDIKVSKSSYDGKTQLLFKSGKKEVGEISLTARPDGNLEVSNVLVWPEFQRQGHATRFYKAALQEANSQGKKLYISNDRTDDAKNLHAMFERHGWLRPDGQIDFNSAEQFSRDRIPGESGSVESYAKEFDETEHPRDDSGKFSTAGGTSGDSGSAESKNPQDLSKPFTGSIKDKNGQEHRVKYDPETRTFDILVPGKEDVRGVTAGGATMGRKFTRVMWVGIHPEYRRKGLASALYDYIEKSLGYPLQRNDMLTPDGEALWKSRDNNRSQEKFARIETLQTLLRHGDDPDLRGELDRLYVAVGREQYKKDASGHEHAPKGSSKGGQFVSSGGGSDDGDDEKLPAKVGRLSSAKRVGTGKDARIILGNGKAAPNHIKPSMVPPQWTDVQVSLDADSDVLVRARDSKGRIKVVYADNFTMRQAAIKFARVSELVKKRDAISKQNQANRKNPALREEADCLWLIEEQATRPGSDSDTKAKVKAYGATTLLAEHVKVDRDGTVRLDFIGKEGVHHNHVVRNPDLAKMLVERKKSAKNRGGRLFGTNSGKLRDYTRSLDGGRFTPKDFRTAKATVMAVDEIKKLPDCCKNKKEYKAAVKQVATVVSGVLGNRPQQAISSYINPTVWAAWQCPDCAAGDK